MCGLAYCRQGISETAGMYVCLKDYVPDWLYLLIATGLSRRPSDHVCMFERFYVPNFCTLFMKWWWQVVLMVVFGWGQKPKCLERILLKDHWKDRCIASMHVK